MKEELKKMGKPAEFLTPGDLVERWGGTIGKGTLANWRNKGRGPAYVKVGGRVVYPLDKVESWEQQNLKSANDNQQ